MNKPAEFWLAAENGSVHCELCPHNCKIPENASGICGVRENRGGSLFAAGYGAVSAVALDPIEKKPLYMFRPGKKVLSIGGFSCNFRCPFCQNFGISLYHGGGWRDAERLSPEAVARLAVQAVPEGNIGAAYTYNEPLIGYEFVRDCAELINEAGLCNVVVTNGYINREPLEKLLPVIDAMNIDLKGFTGGFYKKLGGLLDAVKDTIRLAHGSCHVEVTTLVIPGENDTDIGELAGWLASIDPEIPLHLTRFFPRYKYSDKEPTPRETIYRLSEIAKRQLRNVFCGNL